MGDITGDNTEENIEKVTKLFMVERILYVSFSTLAGLICVATVVITLVQQHFNTVNATMFFGSGGLFTVSFNRLLSQWNRSMDMLDKPHNGTKSTDTKSTEGK